MVGRSEEIQSIKKLARSNKSEFLVVYGRRRVGKTYLIREVFNYTFDFQLSGLANANTKQQLSHFHDTFAEFCKDAYPKAPHNWLEAFNRLKKHLAASRKAKKTVFIDELPWLDTQKSDFLVALESFWNAWATNRKDILLIGTGSAASWIISKLINNRGGLHNRVTMQLKLLPFTLCETEQFLQSKNIRLSRLQLCELYMATGGMPYYLDLADTGKSAAQIVEELFFLPNAKLGNEYGNLYKALFKSYQHHEKIVEALSTKAMGLTRGEIAAITGLPSGGTMSRHLTELEESGFIHSYLPYNAKTKNTTYRLTDFYTLFYFKFIKGNRFFGKNTWPLMADSPTYHSWAGYSFESLCYYHILQIKKALGISGILSSAATWRNEHTQIDLLIDRRDQVINLIEIKYSISAFAIDKTYDANLRLKINEFKTATKTKKAVFLTFITANGLAQNKYSGLVQSEVVLDDLF